MTTRNCGVLDGSSNRKRPSGKDEGKLKYKP